MKKLSKEIEELSKIVKDDISNSCIYNKLEKISEQIDDLSINDVKAESLQEKMDKFDENFKRFEIMFNEFKGCIAMTRANLKATQKKKDKK